MLVTTDAPASDGSAVYYLGVVHCFVDRQVPPRARQLAEQNVEELLHSSRPDL